MRPAWSGRSSGETAAALRSRRGDDWLWRQDYRGLGTLYGVARNAVVLLRVEPDDVLAAETAAVLARHTFREDGDC